MYHFGLNRWCNSKAKGYTIFLVVLEELSKLTELMSNCDLKLNFYSSTLANPAKEVATGGKGSNICGINVGGE